MKRVGWDAKMYGKFKMKKRTILTRTYKITMSWEMYCVDALSNADCLRNHGTRSNNRGIIDRRFSGTKELERFIREHSHIFYNDTHYWYTFMYGRVPGKSEKRTMNKNIRQFERRQLSKYLKSDDPEYDGVFTPNKNQYKKNRMGTYY